MGPTNMHGRKSEGRKEPEKKDVKSYCRECGDERWHFVCAEVPRNWEHEGTPVHGGEIWSILKCKGCKTVSFLHTEWDSVDVEDTDDGPEPIVHRRLYPPTPSRKMPEWGNDIYLCDIRKENSESDDASWTEKDYPLVRLHKDIYAAIGLNAYALAAMGIRAIVDVVVTSNAGEALKGCKDKFRCKLQQLEQTNLISKEQVEVIYSAFDAGSAAAHRLHRPTQQEVYTQLNIAETLLQQIYIDPERRRRQVAAAAVLKSKTPPPPWSK